MKTPATALEDKGDTDEREIDAGKDPHPELQGAAPGFGNFQTCRVQCPPPTIDESLTRVPIDVPEHRLLNTTAQQQSAARGCLGRDIRCHGEARIEAETRRPPGVFKSMVCMSRVRTVARTFARFSRSPTSSPGTSLARRSHFAGRSLS